MAPYLKVYRMGPRGPTFTRVPQPPPPPFLDKFPGYGYGRRSNAWSFSGPLHHPIDTDLYGPTVPRIDLQKHWRNFVVAAMSQYVEY